MKTKRKIVINGRFLSQSISGVQRFAYEMTKSLISMGIDITVLTPRNINAGYSLDGKIIRWGVNKGHLWEQFDLFLYLKTHGNPLMINFSGLGPIHYKNQICTIHDLSYLINPAWFSRNYYRFYRYCTPVLAKNCKKIITVSNYSKNEITRLLKVNPDKVCVIYNAVDFSNIKPSGPEKLSTQPYILSVGSIDPRKNLVKLFEAFNKSQIKDKYRLVLVGEKANIFSTIDSDDINKNWLGYVSDEELVYLYKNASLFVYLSLYEGFGIPPLEAMSLGCPVILSDIPVFHEIFGDSAYYVSPENTEEITNTMHKIISDNNAREEIIKKSFETSSHYSWKKSASLLIKLIEEL